MGSEASSQVGGRATRGGGVQTKDLDEEGKRDATQW